MSINFTITPGIENRLAFWSRQAQSPPQRVAGPCVTISREFGCQGYPTAEALEKLFNADKTEEERWITLDRKLLEKIAEDSGFSKSEVQNIGDVHPIWRATMSLFMGKQRPESYEIFNYIKKAVRYFAKAGNCIIVGRAGGIIAQDLPNCLHIRLVAPLEFRIQHIMQLMNMTEKEARQYIDLHQHQRDLFFQHFTNKQPDTPTLYHLVINNEKHTPEQIAHIIKDELKWQNLL